MAQPGQIANWCGQAGWSGTDRITATAVALAASHGNPNAAGGLFGIGTTGDGPAQAKAAYGTWKTDGWGAFPAHRNGAWLLWYPTAVAGVGALGAAVETTDPIGAARQATNAVAAGAAQVGGPFQEAAVVLRFLTSDQSWQRITKVVLGVTLLAIAAATLANAMWVQPFIRTVYRVDRRVQEQAAVSNTP